MLARLAALVLIAATPALAAPEPEKPSEPVKTSDQVKKGSVEGAVSAPLRDLNVVRTKIPPILLETLEDPYAKPPKGWKCSTIARLVRPLDAALGDDLDRLPPGDEDLVDRGRSTALGAAADLASDVIPFRGWVRKLSGAEKHDKLVQSAIVAGDVRRAYLKGLGEAKGCAPPAAPIHDRTAAVKAAAAKANSNGKTSPNEKTGGKGTPDGRR